MMWNNAGRFAGGNVVITQPAEVPEVPEHIPVNAPDLFVITRRERDYATPTPGTVAINVQATPGTKQPRRVDSLQLMWHEHVMRVFLSSQPDMWRVFCSVMRETKKCQDAVLGAVGKLGGVTRRWPQNRRQLDNLITRAGGFQSRILRIKKIDMSDVSDKLSQIEFNFVDPIYAWCCAAATLGRSGEELLFKYEPQYRDGQRFYGSTVACGEIMRLACDRVASKFVCDICVALS